jgi:hypothetical protein
MFKGLADTFWVPAVISRETPASQKWRIIRSALAVDPLAGRRLAAGLATAVRLKVLAVARGLARVDAR